jgi:hypothetical protein
MKASSPNIYIYRFVGIFVGSPVSAALKKKKFSPAHAFAPDQITAYIMDLEPHRPLDIQSLFTIGFYY